MSTCLGVVDLHERAEQAHLVFSVDAGACIFHGNGDTAKVTDATLGACRGEVVPLCVNLAVLESKFRTHCDARFILRIIKADRRRDIELTRGALLRCGRLHSVERAMRSSDGKSKEAGFSSSLPDRIREIENFIYQRQQMQ